MIGSTPTTSPLDGYNLVRSDWSPAGRAWDYAFQSAPKQ
jgi:hypothetical protein